MKYLIVGTMLALAACAVPKGRPLAVSGSQAFETFEPLIDCAGLAGLMASELPGAVEIQLDEATILRYYIAGEGYYLHVIVDPAGVAEGEAPEREAVGMARGDELFACAEERRAARGPTESMPEADPEALEAAPDSGATPAGQPATEG